MFIAMIAAASLAVLDGDVATTASAPPATPSDQAPAASTQAPSQKKVCRTYVPTGSRLGGERICKTQEEWNQISRESREVTDDQVRHGMQISRPPNVTGG